MIKEVGHLTLYMLIGPIAVSGGLSAAAGNIYDQEGLSIALICSAIFALGLGSFVYVMFYRLLNNVAIKYLGAFYLATFVATLLSTILSFNGVFYLFT